MKALLLLGTSAILTAAAGIASAQTATTPAAGATTATPAEEEVVITGTRRVDRTVSDSASPIDVISSEDLVAQSSANMMDQVKYLVPSFVVGQNTISDASTIVRS